MTVNRDGIVDLLARTHQALRITAGMMREQGLIKDSIAAEGCGAFIEALAAALEHDIDEVLVAQLVPLIKALAQATGDENYETESTLLQEQVNEFIHMIRLARGTDNDPLEITIESGTIN